MPKPQQPSPAALLWQLMLGFRAETTQSECRYHDDEIEEARWFSRDDLRSLFAGGLAGRHGAINLPRSISIARRLICEWVDEA